MTRRLTIAISGYGIAGVAAAIELRRLGHVVEHFEHSKQCPGTGAGLLLHPRAIESLAALGARDAVTSVGLRVSRLLARTRTGREVMNFALCEGSHSAHGLGVLRGTLMEILGRCDPGHDDLRRGIAVRSVDPADGKLHLSDGSTRGPYDLVVAADGANSAIRRGLPDIVARDRLYDSAAIAVAVDDPSGLAGDLLSQYFDGTRHVSVWPIGSFERENIRKANVSINVPLAQIEEALADGRWRHQATRICPELVPLLDPKGPAAAMPVAYSYRDVILRSYVHGRVVLIGDAAHSMSPQLGQGASLALQDAQRLAAEVAHAGEPQAALARFNAGQMTLIPPVQRACRWLTPMFQSENRPLAMLRDMLGGPVSRSRAVRSRLDRLLIAA